SIQEIFGIFRRRDFGLHDHFFARKRWKQPPKLHFGCTVAPSGLDVVDAQLERAMDGCFEIALVLRGDFGWRNILPFELITHSAAREDRHLQLGASETAVFHPNSV